MRRSAAQAGSGYRSGQSSRAVRSDTVEVDSELLESADWMLPAPFGPARAITGPLDGRPRGVELSRRAGVLAHLRGAVLLSSDPDPQALSLGIEIGFHTKSYSTPNDTHLRNRQTQPRIILRATTLTVMCSYHRLVYFLPRSPHRRPLARPDECLCSLREWFSRLVTASASPRFSV